MPPSNCFFTKRKASLVIHHTKTVRTRSVFAKHASRCYRNGHDNNDAPTVASLPVSCHHSACTEVFFDGENVMCAFVQRILGAKLHNMIFRCKYQWLVVMHSVTAAKLYRLAFLKSTANKSSRIKLLLAGRLGKNLLHLKLTPVAFLRHLKCPVL